MALIKDILDTDKEVVKRRQASAAKDRPPESEEMTDSSDGQTKGGKAGKGGVVEQIRGRQPESESNQEPDDGKPFGMEPADEDMQKQYDGVMTAAWTMVYGDQENDQALKASDQVFDLLQKGAKDPATTIANTTLWVVGTLDGKIQGGIPEDVIIQVAEEVAMWLAQIMNDTGLATMDERLMGQVGQALTIGLADMGVISPEEVEDLLAHTRPEDAQRYAQEQHAYATPADAQPQEQMQ